MKKLILLSILLIVGCEGVYTPEDCAGVAGGDAVEDNCGACVTPDDTSCVQGCAGEWKNDGTQTVNDVCMICGGDGSSCYGCTDNTATNFVQGAIVDDGSCEYRMSLDLSMSDELELTISLSHPLGSIEFLGFSVVYNTNVLNISSYSNGQFGLLFTNLDYGIYELASFLLSNITDAGTLLTLQFQGTNYEGTTIYLSDISIVENNGEEILLDDSNFYSESICYISVHPITGEILFGGEYQWTNNFCFPLNYNP